MTHDPKSYWQAAQDFAMCDRKSEHKAINDANAQIAEQMGIDLAAQPLGLAPAGTYQVHVAGRDCKATIDGTILHLISYDAESAG